MQGKGANLGHRPKQIPAPSLQRQEQATPGKSNSEELGKPPTNFLPRTTV